ncbi:hypothetical protein TERTU_3111 [Teredinibacter turnerae T7901]|uniref:Uncharacterized protein n=1 Tax=Teredinibacter turnerae (strain ATCC 39867 / T7901) TaxID=377629 RepID=C5BP88_TERTT|nr:hypothetical protein TERTU_3111 [Teredinibacter turnerae T7901]
MKREYEITGYTAEQFALLASAWIETLIAIGLITRLAIRAPRERVD